MTEFDIHINLMKDCDTPIFHVSIHPINYSGAIPYKFFTSFNDVAFQLIRFGFEQPSLRGIQVDFASKGESFVLRHAIPAEAAEEFGWHG